MNKTTARILSAIVFTCRISKISAAFYVLANFPLLSDDCFSFCFLEIMVEFKPGLRTYKDRWKHELFMLRRKHINNIWANLQVFFVISHVSGGAAEQDCGKE